MTLGSIPPWRLAKDDFTHGRLSGVGSLRQSDPESLNATSLNSLHFDKSKAPIGELDYFQTKQASPLQEGVCRWAISRFPLKVYFHSNTDFLLPEEVQNTCFDSAMATWEVASRGQVGFQIVNLLDDANVMVSWQDKPNLQTPYEVGMTQREVSFCSETNQLWITKVRITLVQETLVDLTLHTQSQLETRLFATFLHELGHALGLEHGSHPKDIMYYQGWRNTVPSPRDQAALRLRYPAGVLGRPLGGDCSLYL